MLILRTAGGILFEAGFFSIYFASVLAVSAQATNPIPPPVQLRTPITVAYQFSAATNYATFLGHTNQEGAFCVANLVQDAAGWLYGVAPEGGAYGGGTVFRVMSDGKNFTVLHTFTSLAYLAPPPQPTLTNPDGNKPTGLILGVDGWLYGTTAQGGTNGSGTIFKLSTDGANFTNLYNFAGNDGANPQGGLIQGPDGTFYGTAKNGGTNGTGTVFCVNPDGSAFTVLHHFTALNGGTNEDGTQPCSGLVLANDDTLYGTARYGGPSGSVRGFSPSPVGSGTLFSIKTNGANFSVIHAFTTFSGDFLQPTNGDGASPTAALLLGQDGRLYGTAPEAGPAGVGALFRLDCDGSDFTVLYGFGRALPFGYLKDASYGLSPYGGLVQGSDGLLYGAAYSGGYFPNGGYFAGTLYRIGPDGSGLALLHTFGEKDPLTNTNADGANPSGALLQANDGKFYGLTSAGGVNASGILFSFAPPVALEVSASNSLVVLNWPASATNFILETSDTAVPGSTWIPVTNGVVTVSNSLRVSLSPNSPAAFFRLHLR